MDLSILGFDDFFEENTEKDKLKDFSIVRIVSVNKQKYTVLNGQHTVFAEITGRMMYNIETSLDYPTVGDWVYARFLDNNTSAIIEEIITRKNLLKRKTPGKKIDFQLIASNIDTAFIIQSLDNDFNINRLERYLVMINEDRINPVILLSKSDKISKELFDEKINEIKNNIKDIEIIPFSNLNNDGLDIIKKKLLSGQTFCFLGSSGVGKTSLLNNLIGFDKFSVKGVREKDSKGRHTTTNRQLTILENGAMIIDTPGMREVGSLNIDEGLDETFNEITELSSKCKFNNCSHIKEKGCAILKAVKENTISEERYKNYMKMRRENEFHEMSYYEKRKKDKAFAKYCKSVMKNQTKY